MEQTAAPESTFLDVHGTRIHLRSKGQGRPVLVLPGEDAASRWRRGPH